MGTKRDLYITCWHWGFCVGGNANFSFYVGGNANFSVFRFQHVGIPKGLVTNYGEGGGLQNGRGGGACEVLPLQKKGGGAENVLAMLKGGGHKKFWGSPYTLGGSFSHIVGGGGHVKYSLFKKGGGAKRFTLP